MLHASSAQPLHNLNWVAFRPSSGVCFFVPSHETTVLADGATFLSFDLGLGVTFLLSV
jgi:hypothetical protein